MPIYEYRCDECTAVITKLRPISECKEPVEDDCKNGVADRKLCKFKRIMSATPTTFRFNDKTGFKGLDKKRG